MLRRQKALLYLIFVLQQYKLNITKTYLDKLLFLLKKETNIDKSMKFYNFFPYNYGPFSNQFYFDLNDLQNRGYISEKLELMIPIDLIEVDLSKHEKQLIDGIVNKYRLYDAKKITNHVYLSYPEYTSKSVLKNRPKTCHDSEVFSVGYENKDIDLFLDLLIQNYIDVVVDVRANPFSMNLAFTKKKLSNYLKKVGIEYLHIPELGINGKYRKELKDDKDYAELFAFYSRYILPKQMTKVEELFELGKRKRVALMCFEQDKNHCHRSVLSKILEEYGLKVSHL